MRRFSWAAAAVAVLVSGAAAVRADNPPVAARVDVVFARWSADTPGCAVGVDDGHDVLRRAYGSADLEHGVANGPDTVFEAGSVSKQFTAAAVLLLGQAGKLSVDDPVRKYVPELPDYGVPLTIRHMLHHTSGLRDWGTVVEAAGWPRGTRAHTHAHVLDVVSRQKALNFPPGREYLYSNTNYNLLAIIVERVSGRSFAQYTREAIFEPLAMTRTGWRDDYTRIVKDRAVAYERRPDGYHLSMPFENVHGNGGLLTTVSDLLRWNENFASGKVGGRALADELQRRGRLDSGREIAYARGLVVSDFRGVPEVAHSGATAGYRAFLARYPGSRLSVAVLCNSAEADAPALAHDVAGVYLGSAFAPRPAPTPAPVPAAALDERAGLYRNLRTGEALRLTRHEGTLRLEGRGDLVPLSETLFTLGEGGPRLRFAATGGARGFDLLTPDGDTLRCAAAEEFRPSAADLNLYEGTYVSDEAEVAYTMKVENGSLVAFRRPDARFVLAPAYRDAFTATYPPLVLFLRDDQGAVTGLSLGLGRVRDLRFRRAPAAPGR